MTKRILISIFILFLAIGSVFGQEEKYQLFVFGGMHSIFEYGSEDDYLLGENDFPVTPAHSPACFGASFAYFFTNKIGIELDGKYILPYKLTLKDPSDGDTIKINTSKRFSLSLNFIYQLLNGKVSPFLVLGGGIDKLIAKDETYTSELGYEVALLAPEKTIDPFVQAGGGIEYFVSEAFGIKLDVRYVLLFSEPDNINSVSGSLGVFFRF